MAVRSSPKSQVYDTMGVLLVFRKIASSAYMGVVVSNPTGT
jgi:hypothetical protein